MPGFFLRPRSASTKKSPALGPGFGVRRGERGDASRETLLAGYQLKRGPTNHWVSPSISLTSADALQFGVNFTCAPMRP